MARRALTPARVASWRDPPASAARRAAVYATPAFARQLLRATRPFAAWSAVVERQEEASAVIEAAYGDGEPGRGVVGVTVLVRIEVRSKAGTRTTRQAVAVRLEAASGGWLVGGIDP